jgi:hypothetical protein
MKTFLVSILLVTASFAARADHPAIHGMLVFGGKTTYLSHLPMFHAPHDYQVILEASLDIKAKATAEYEALKNAEETLFTIAPESMDLTKVIDGSIQNFKADLYQGHFEQGGKNLGKVMITINKVIFSKKLDPKEETTSQEPYLVFGKNGEYFAAHIITSKPNFDAIFKVTQPYTLDFPHCRTRVCGEPIQTPVLDSALPVIVHNFLQSEIPTVGESLGSWSGSSTNVLQVIYSEEAELSH